MKEITTDEGFLKLRWKVFIPMQIFIFSIAFTLSGYLFTLKNSIERTEYVDSRSERLAKNAKEDAIAETKYHVLQTMYNQLKEECENSK